MQPWRVGESQCRGTSSFSAMMNSEPMQMGRVLGNIIPGGVKGCVLTAPCPF